MEIGSNKNSRIKKSEVVYTCSICQENIVGLARWRRHSVKHNTYVLCQIDSVHFVSEESENSTQPQRNCVKIPPYVCLACGKKYTYLTNFRRHVCANSQKKTEHKFPASKQISRSKKQSESKNKFFKCLSCDKKFRSCRNLERHENSHNKANLQTKDSNVETRQSIVSQPIVNATIDLKEDRTCQTCGRVYSTIGNLKTHQNVHTRKKLYHCDICQQSFTYASTLKQHYLTHSGEKLHLCTVCGKCFAKKSTLTQHARLHSGNLPYNCKECNKSFNTKAELRFHTINHTGVYPLKCDICNKGFRKMTFLRAHLESQSCHHDKKTRRKNAERFPCKSCKKVLRTERSLDKHMLAHTGEHPYFCEICDIGFIQKKNYLSHFSKHEETLKNGGEIKSQRECDICGKRFTKAYYLREHYRSHTGALPFECNYCGRKFNFKGSLKNHVARFHTGDFPLKCTICDQGFCKKYKLQNHMETHYKTREQEFAEDIPCN